MVPLVGKDGGRQKHSYTVVTEKQKKIRSSFLTGAFENSSCVSLVLPVPKLIG